MISLSNGIRILYLVIGFLFYSVSVPVSAKALANNNNKKLGKVTRGRQPNMYLLFSKSWLNLKRQAEDSSLWGS